MGALLAYARQHEPRLAIGYRLALRYPLRWVEIAGLRWDDIDQEMGRLHVRQNLVAVGGQLVMGEPETRSGRRSIPFALDLRCPITAGGRSQTGSQPERRAGHRPDPPALAAEQHVPRTRGGGRAAGDPVAPGAALVQLAVGEPGHPDLGAAGVDGTRSANQALMTCVSAVDSSC